MLVEPMLCRKALTLFAVPLFLWGMSVALVWDGSASTPTSRPKEDEAAIAARAKQEAHNDRIVATFNSVRCCSAASQRPRTVQQLLVCDFYVGVFVGCSVALVGAPDIYSVVDFGVHVV